MREVIGSGGVQMARRVGKLLLGPDKDPKAGMKLKTRTVKSLAGATFVAVFLCMGAGTALAGTLLSGYGGPGEGNQAILGAGLVNAPSGGGPGGGSGGGSGAAGSPSAAALSQASSSRSSAAASSGGQGTRGKGTGSSTGKPSRTPGAGAGGYRAAHTPPGAAEPVPAASAGSQPLGLSGSDVLYILLALAALVVTALLTRQLTHGPERGARG